MNTLLIKGIASFLTTTTLAGASLIPAPINHNTTTVTINSTTSPIKDEAPDPLDLWIDELVQLESGGKEHIKILDVNGFYSYGCLQFQMETFYRNGLKYGLLTKDNEDSLGTLIYSCDLQKDIAKAMIQDKRSNWRHWYTSVAKKKLGPPPVMIDLAQAK